MFTWDQRWEVVIGLEVHTQLQTKSKIFSGSSIAYGAEPNTQASAVDIALPGVLPVMNLEAAKLAVKFGLAIGAEINQRNVCLLYTSPSPRDGLLSRMPSSA